MSSDDIREKAQPFSELHLHRPEGREDLLVAQRGDTLIHLEVNGSGLQAFQVSWTSGLTQQSYALKNNLCSGQQLVQLHILGDPGHAGAAVLLDGDQVGELSRQGTWTVDVPLGEHTLTVKKGSSTWSAERRYDSSSSGYDRLPIPADALASASLGETSLSP